MRLHRFFVKENIERNSEIEIYDKRIVHQVRNVFRLGVGDKTIIFNGDGFDYECEIIKVGIKNLELQIINSKQNIIPEKKVILFMSLIKKENFELVSEKATEIGVTKIVPIVSERTLLKKINKERIEKILVEASEQCGRGDVPEFCEIANLELSITNLNTEEILVADFDGVSIKDLKTKNSKTNIFIGPEGGWSDEERKLFKEKNIKIFSLGSTTLRAETAAIVSTFSILN